MSVETRHKALPPTLAPRGLSRVEAAAYLGVSASEFDERVRNGRLPKPKVIDEELIWDRFAFDAMHIGFVYFIRSYCRNYVKIGFARDVNKRLRGLQCANPEPLVLLATEPGTRDNERWNHDIFSSLRVSGEWFLLTDDAKRYIVEVTDLHVSADEVWK